MPRQKMFKNMKLQEKYSMWLQETMSAVSIDSKTSKYVVFKTVDSKGDLFWFLGKSGAVRICRTNTSTKSMDFERQIKPKFKVWEETKLEVDNK